MLPATRLLDIGIGVCTAHPPVIHSTVGFVISSQMTVLVNGLPAAKMLDMVITACGGVGYIVGGSSKVLVQGLPMTNMMTQFVGTFTGTIVGGSGNVYCM